MRGEEGAAAQATPSCKRPSQRWARWRRGAGAALRRTRNGHADMQVEGLARRSLCRLPPRSTGCWAACRLATAGLVAFQPRNGGGRVTRGSVDGGPTTGACVIRDGDFERPWGGVARPRPDAIMDECNSCTIAPVCASIRTTHRRACEASLPQGLPPLAKHALSTCATSERRMAAHASTPAWLLRRPQREGAEVPRSDDGGGHAKGSAGCYGQRRRTTSPSTGDGNSGGRSAVGELEWLVRCVGPSPPAHMRQLWCGDDGDGGG